MAKSLPLRFAPLTNGITLKLIEVLQQNAVTVHYRGHGMLLHLYPWFCTTPEPYVAGLIRYILVMVRVLCKTLSIRVALRYTDNIQHFYKR